MSNMDKFYMDLAESYEKQGNYERALFNYEKVVDEIEVHEVLGLFYYYGKGCEKNLEKAKKHFEILAQQGDLDSLCNQALCEQNLLTKMELYKSAAEQGSAYAMNMVGRLIELGIENGNHVIWYKKAADLGEMAGKYNYAMHIADVDEKIKYLESAVEDGYEAAILKYAHYLENGIYVEKNLEKAKELKEKIQNE